MFIRALFRKITGVPGHSLVIALAVLLLGTSPAPGMAQTTRAEVIAAEQKAKAARLQPEGPPAWERTLAGIIRSPLLGGRNGLYPWFSRIYPGTGFGLGVGYHKQLPDGGRVNVLGAMSFGDSWLIGAQARLPDIKEGLLALALDGGWMVAKRLRYYGRGPQTVKDKSVLYDLELGGAGATVVLQPVRWFHLDGGYRYLTVDSRSSSAPLDGAFNTGQGLSYHVLRAVAAIDWRTAPGYSVRGGLYRVTWSHLSEAQNRPYSFSSIEYEVVQMLPLLREQYVLAVRGLATVTMTEPGNEVPFTLAPTLGGTDMLRGFDTRRFTDRNRLILTAEYRWQPSRFIEMAVFYEAGKVTARARDLSLSHLETDWGIGARFHTPALTVLRVEAAKSREGWRLIVSVHPAF